MRVLLISENRCRENLVPYPLGIAYVAAAARTSNALKIFRMAFLRTMWIYWQNYCIPRLETSRMALHFWITGRTGHLPMFFFGIMIVSVAGIACFTQQYANESEEQDEPV